MTGFLIPHSEPTIEHKKAAVAAWREAAQHERFRVENGLCYGFTGTALHNAELYERVADEIQSEIDADKGAV